MILGQKHPYVADQKCENGRFLAFISDQILTKMTKIRYFEIMNHNVHPSLKNMILGSEAWGKK